MRPFFALLLLLGSLNVGAPGAIASAAAVCSETRSDEPVSEAVGAIRSLAAELPRDRQRMDELQREKLEELGLLQQALLRSALEALLELGACDRERRLGLELLHSSAGPDDVPLALALATPDDPEGFVSRPVLDALEELLAEQHRSAAAGTQAIARAFLDLDRTLQDVCLRAVQRYSGRRTIQFMEDFLGLDPVLDRSLLVPLARLWSQSPDPPQHSSLLLIRSFLDSRDDASRREAALALGWLDDEDGVSRLVVALDDSHYPVRHAALWSLRRLSGQRFRASAELWSRWLEQSRRWWDERSESVFAALSGDDVTAYVRALNEVGSQRLRRRQLVAQAEIALLRQEPVLVGLACAAFEQIGSPAAVPPLVELLQREEEEVRRHAQRALTHLTGEALPAEHQAWSRWLRDR